MRRFAAFRNQDTGEVGYFLRIPLKTFDFLRQGALVLLLSFFLTFGVMVTANGLDDSDSKTDSTVTTEQITQQIDDVVEDLKALAREEADLQAQPSLSSEQKKRLEELRARRMELIKKLQELERRGKG
jgi:hypothetical protein